MGATIVNSLSKSSLKTNDKGLNLFFYDANLEGVDNLISYLSEGFKINPIERTDNFFTKLSNYSNSKIDNLYILCHGQAGELKLGREEINTESLLNHSKRNTSIEIEKITLLSCNVGQNTNFIHTFAKVFNCAVNFSDKLVGHQSLGGSWDLKTYISDESAHNLSLIHI